jgi:hypothetical protein
MYNMYSMTKMKKCMKGACVMAAFVFGFKLGYSSCRARVKSVL